ncbi:MAG TPA: carboxypeptidase regulatory-like domain-containing protein, partial [Solirubrobacterales bacterium]|nr:carboxypeptidase regulatory-like domain-containing protein [Solirubrobacterales bacterium]
FVFVCAVPASALAVGSISGTVTAATGGAPLTMVEVCAEAVNEESFECAAPEADGTYTIAELEPGDYLVEFWPYGDNDYVRQYFDGASRWSDADPVTVSDGADADEIDAALLSGGRITGRVVDAATKAGIGGAEVCALSIGGEATGRCTWADGDGDYAVRHLLPGSYEVFAWDEAGVYQEAAYPDPVSVFAGTATPGVDIEMGAGGQIAGTVTDALSGAAIRFSLVCARDALDGEIYGCDYTEGAGHYAIGALPTGTYKAWFSPDVPEWEEEDDYFQQYYNGASSFAGATAVAVVAPGIVAGIDARLSSRHAPPSPPAPSASAPPVGTAVVKPPVAKMRPKVRCPKGKRLVKRKGKAKCVKKIKRSAMPRHSAR